MTVPGSTVAGFSGQELGKGPVKEQRLSTGRDHLPLTSWSLELQVFLVGCACAHPQGAPALYVALV